MYLSSRLWAVYRTLHSCCDVETVAVLGDAHFHIRKLRFFVYTLPIISIICPRKVLLCEFLLERPVSVLVALIQIVWLRRHACREDRGVCWTFERGASHYSRVTRPIVCSTTTICVEIVFLCIHFRSLIWAIFAGKIERWASGVSIKSGNTI